MSDQFMDDYKRDTVKAMADRIEALEAALRDSQSLLAMINHLGAIDGGGISSTAWDHETLSTLLADQITDNRAALAPEQDK
jgi:hypothetical protein